MEQDPKVVPGEKLAYYLGSESRQFAQYADVDVAAGNYVSADGSGFATVEIFRFPDFVKAFGAYSIHKGGPMQFLPVENEAFASKAAIHLWRGPFYVRVTGLGGSGGPKALMELLGSVTARMPAAPAKPAVFGFLPVVGRIANTERYSAEKGFGQSYLGNSFQADFQTPDGPVTGLVIPAASRDTAARILGAYRSLYIHNGKLLDPIPNLGEENFSAEDKYLGRAVAFRIDRFLVAFNGYTDRQRLVDLAIATDQRILGTIRKQLVSADNQADVRPAPANPNVPSWPQRP